MSHQRVQSPRVHLFIGIIFIVVSAVAILLIIYLAVMAWRWLSGQWAEVNPTVLASLITGAVTILSSVLIASYNARRAQERAAEEANRGRKVDIYNEFVGSLAKMLMGHITGKQISHEEMATFMATFAYQLMVYGGPEVIKVFGEWRVAGENATARRQASPVHA